mgnify:CR=1 FL=1
MKSRCDATLIAVDPACAPTSWGRNWPPTRPDQPWLAGWQTSRGLARAEQLTWRLRLAPSPADVLPCHLCSLQVADPGPEKG